MVETGKGLDVKQIMELLPHRFPFLLVDRVTELEPGKRASGIKMVSLNEWYFQGHFPDDPVMPGFLILESLAQLAGVAILSVPEHKGLAGYLVAVENARFRHPVLPGDQLTMQVEVTAIRNNMCFVKGEAMVGDRLVAEGQMVLALRPGVS
ncbi:MAG: 3-hydroxyacyl-ACP dehydratase FabZ [Armatimonadetes bacterium]|nr:3-hydroxyacyl-ACP dehydratase FabZ [Armatimonadota bacterium]MDW8121066.1 3-hydroxyacyl-ACP dehydratase FabZ [Armatimonadota bacterium]